MPPLHIAALITELVQAWPMIVQSPRAPCASISSTMARTSGSVEHAVIAPTESNTTSTAFARTAAGKSS